MDSRFLLVKDTKEMMVQVGSSVSVCNSDAAKISHVNCEWCEEKSC